MNKLLQLLTVMLVLSSCKSPEARQPVTASSGSFIDASVARNIELIAKETARFESIMEKDSDHEYIASESGFWYFYNTMSDDSSEIKPDFGDIVRYDYNVKSIQGGLIYSKEDINTQTYIMDKQELFTGLREGLKLMQAGETVTFFFPSQKAFGYYGDENKIGTNVPLICEVTVHEIINNQTN